MSTSRRQPGPGRPREASLYPAVKQFLVQRGYDPKGEVGHCDVVATSPAEPGRLIIVEMKRSLTLDLLLQATDRLPCADELWIAVPATRKGRDRDRRAHKLCRRLGIGLIAITPAGRIEILAEPTPYHPRPNTRRRAALLREHEARGGDPSPGGTGGVPVMTAYRQEALACAARLRRGPLPTRALVDITPRATVILYRNVYGWFDRPARGVYALTETGHAALDMFASRDATAAPTPPGIDATDTDL